MPSANLHVRTHRTNRTLPVGKAGSGSIDRVYGITISSGDRFAGSNHQADFPPPPHSCPAGTRRSSPLRDSRQKGPGCTTHRTSNTIRLDRCCQPGTPIIESAPYELCCQPQHDSPLPSVVFVTARAIPRAVAFCPESHPAGNDISRPNAVLRSERVSLFPVISAAHRSMMALLPTKANGSCAAHGDSQQAIAEPSSESGPPFRSE